MYADLWVALVDDRRLTKVRARSLVVATGCEDQPAVFGNNDLPGVLLGEGARRLMERYAVRPADQPLVLTAGSDGYLLADAMRGRGIGIAAVVDLRTEAADPEPGGDREMGRHSGLQRARGRGSPAGAGPDRRTRGAHPRPRRRRPTDRRSANRRLRRHHRLRGPFSA